MDEGYVLQVKSNQLQTAAIVLALPITLCDITKVKHTEFLVVLFYAMNDTVVFHNLSSYVKELFRII